MIFSMKKCANSLWQICGRNKWKVTGTGWDQMSSTAKTLDFARGCNSIQNQLVNFSYFPSFGTVKSEVQLLSPRPVTQDSSITYGRERLRSFFTVVANLWTKIFPFTELPTFSAVTICKKSPKNGNLKAEHTRGPILQHPEPRSVKV